MDKTSERYFDICVIGAGAAGLSVAAGASMLGAATVLIERHRMGGDCLNTGCIPSKSLLAAAKMAERIRHADGFGVRVDEPKIDFGAVRQHVQGVIAAIAPTDSIERFEGLGVTVIRGEARFVSPEAVEVNGTRIRARRFVIAAGSRAAVPTISGIGSVPYLTNETIFSLTELPKHLVIIGGGPIGLEMAQAHRRLGAEVTVLEARSILPKDDPELVGLLRQRLLAEGIDIRENVAIKTISPATDGIHLGLEGQAKVIEGSHLLIATGRTPNTAALGLAAAGIAETAQGITVDRRLLTTNRRAFAIGDIAGGPQFTHVASYQAGIIIRNALFRVPAKVDYRALPWVTYAEPELAHVGLTEAAAKAVHPRITVLRWPLHDNDRARTERIEHGLVKAVTTPSGRILGASILGEQAGELIQIWQLAISQGLKISAIANMISPYPTLGEASKRAAGSFYTPKLFSERTKSILRFLAKLG
jgi:pyruvate/2-oxoglutarate dehydrogenase complex dihydrolipoamide dehydrogenase (E3) component